MTSQTARPDLAGTALRALGAALLGAGIWIAMAGPLNVTWGLLAVAVFVGWLVGSAARGRSAGTGRSHPRARSIAVVGALLAWGLGLAGVYLYSLAALPGLGPAGSSLGERMALTPIGAFYAQQFSFLDALDLIALVGVAWWSARA